MSNLLPDRESPEFAPALRELRIRLNISKLALCNMANLSRDQLRRYENPTGRLGCVPQKQCYDALVSALESLLAASKHEKKQVVRLVAAPVADHSVRTFWQPTKPWERGEFAAVTRIRRGHCDEDTDQ